MSEGPSTTGGNGDAGRRISFDYLKSPHFRVIRADGAIGSITPNGHIHFALFSERPAIPLHIVHELNPDGSLGEQLPNATVSKGGIVREMEVDVFLTIESARNIKEWLEGKIEEADKRQGRSQKQGN